MAYLYIATVLAVLSFITCGEAIRCWTCSSDLEPQCGDPFNHTSPIFNLHNTLTNCDASSNPSFSIYNSKSVCKKAVKTEYGRKVVSRSCGWLRSHDEPVGDCTANTANPPSYSKIEFCETCDTDGCNGAEQIGAVIWKAIIPFAFALWFRY